MRIIDCKKDAEIIREVNPPTIVEFLCEACKDKFEKVKENLGKLSVEFELDPYIVRGLDYYTGTVFEVFHPEDSKNAISAGGRYDKLVEIMGGKPSPAVGFAIGQERVAEFLKIDQTKRNGLFIIYTDEGKEKAFSLFRQMVEIKNGKYTDLKLDDIYSRALKEVLKELKVDMSLEPKKSIKSQLRYADSKNFKFVFIIGKNEVEEDKITLRDLEKSAQYEIRNFGEFISYILKSAHFREFED